MEHVFHKIILNIYFDHIHIICLYRIFSVLCTDYMLVLLMGMGSSPILYKSVYVCLLLGYVKDNYQLAKDDPQATQTTQTLKDKDQG